ncbi:hypothetical protein HYE59_10865 [Aggregatibacter actinomycetemcomitans]|uniref:hypothetical protein n=1 Tax=Aggregatibacter actinomycetemcomitans TaxID=714 RepID=UPI00197C7D92|nr:hypothetical protein [Aggregatibacter actinomycetemcomitans]MBN6078008.1 hypothetical protein [Aggregatibacter actinomycetemcomitans]
MSDDKKTSIGSFSLDSNATIDIKISRNIPDGVYIWIELEELGHVFWSVHQNKNVTAYTYGRYYDVDKGGFTGDGVLIKYTGSLAMEYIKRKLYPKSNISMVYKIEDADPQKVIEASDKLWFSSDERPDRTDKNKSLKIYGRVIDDYNLFLRNCVTTTINVLESAGSTIFKWDFEIDPITPHGLFIQLSEKSFMRKKVADYTETMKTIIKK